MKDKVSSDCLFSISACACVYFFNSSFYPSSIVRGSSILSAHVKCSAISRLWPELDLPANYHQSRLCCAVHALTSTVVHCLPCKAGQQTVTETGYSAGQIHESHGLLLLVLGHSGSVISPGQARNFTAANFLDRYVNLIIPCHVFIDSIHLQVRTLQYQGHQLPPSILACIAGVFWGGQALNVGCFLVLQKQLFVSYCIVVWALFGVLQLQWNLS